MKVLICKNEIDGQYPVTLERQGNTYIVTYYKQVRRFYESEGGDWQMRAFAEYGYCIRHQAECAGLLGDWDLLSGDTSGRS